MPPHLQGQENISFSINQILSPNSDGSAMDEENRDQYAYNTYCEGKTDKVANHSGNGGNFGNGYFYPQLGNYWGGDLYNGQYYNGCRLRDSSFYYHGYNNRSSGIYGHDYPATPHLSLDNANAQKFNGDSTLNSYEKGTSNVLGDHSNGCYGYPSLNSSDSGSPGNQQQSEDPRAKGGDDLTPGRHFTAYSTCRYHHDADNSGDVKRAGDVTGSSSCAHERTNAHHGSYSGAFSATKCYGSCCNGYATAAALLTSGLQPSACGVSTLPGPAFTANNSQTALNQQVAAIAAVDSAVAAVSVGNGNLIRMPAHRQLPRSSLLTFPWMESRRERIACKYLLSLFTSIRTVL